jgi:16S rRNA C1402 (ribose-2'-O) methylase RsmI
MARTQKELTEIKLMFYSKPLSEIETWLKKQPTIGELQIVVDGWLHNESNPANLIKLTSIKKKLADISGAQIRPASHSGSSTKKPLLGPGEWKEKKNDQNK